jgi:hypothetical protein
VGVKSHMKNKSTEEIQRLWGDVEVIDAEKDLRVFIKPEDVSSAKTKDPGCCVFAQACKRQFAATKVMFWKSVAYVELPGKDGHRRVERFILSPAMRSLIEDFDKGNPVALSAGFELKRPPPHLTFDGKRENNRRNQKNFRRRQREALIKGSSVGTGNRAYEKPLIVIDMEVRNGKGMVHFKKTAGTEAES